MGYNCCFFLNFVPLHIESPYNFGGTGPILGVKNPLQRVNGHAGRVDILTVKPPTEQYFSYCESTFIRWHRFSWILNALIHGFLNSWFQTLQARINRKIVFR
jgi:hypothetical protein